MYSYVHNQTVMPLWAHQNTMKKILAVLCLLLMLLPGPGLAENAQADLAARFGDEASYEYGGKAYAPKKRSTTLLFAAHDESGLQLCYILAVDDALDRIAAICLPVDTLCPDGLTLAETYAQHLPPEDASIPQPEADSMRLLDAVNSLLPEPLIESRLVLDARGLHLLQLAAVPAEEGLPGDEALKARLKALLQLADALPSSEQMQLLDALSAYLATDVKTGAMMKIADKAKRYELPPTVFLPGAYPAPENGDAAAPQPYIPDGEALPAFLIEYFYDENPW